MSNPQNSGVMDFSKFVTALTAIFKSVPQDKLADLNDLVDHKDAKTVTDLFNGDEQVLPSRVEIGTGPAVSMRGGGVSAQIARASDFAKQEGMVELYNRFEGMLADFGKSINAALKSQDVKMSALAGVISDIAKAHSVLDQAIKSASTAAQQPAAPNGDSFFGKAQIKLTKALKAFRKAEMDEDEDEREERKSKLTDIAQTLKSVLSLISKAEDEESAEDDDVEKAVKAVKSLQGRVKTVLESITKAEEDEKKSKEEEEAKKAATAKAEEDEKKSKEEEEAKKAATAKAEEDKKKAEEEAAKKAGDEGTKRTTDEEKADDTAKAQQAQQAQVKSMLEQVHNGQATMEATMKGIMEMLSGVSRVQSPPNLTVVKGAPLAAIEARVQENFSNLTPDEGAEAGSLMQRHHRAAAGHYPVDRLQSDIANASPNVRSLFVAA